MDHNQIINELFDAAKEGNAARLQELLIPRPEYVNMENAEGLTLLGYAAHFGHPEAVRVIIAAGADVDAVSHSNISFIPSNTALHAAIAGERNMDVIRLLLTHHAGTRIFDSNGHTCLHSAAFHDDNVELIHLLIEYGADVNAQFDEGETAIGLAEKQGNHKVTELLKQCSAPQ
ncbi:hypothetical protein J23TS9_08120 [Paenibacillus sp. J23TS9]|uniref:ankyrin repeat domain-containing protein n=1 Tax=Paenibacillus sp. J23TS9 TaxID=2807193 RepID=UPI001AFEFE94|nr:ankyrin repeat domain-containing protein [Paenibacillus sp. J23TS9]GIP25682.1 hypothetical protein J23TS9_08120 [Paenibacillus sp. J23TS9]